MDEALPQQDEEPEGHKLILASRVEAVDVYNAAGERIGHIDDLSIDREDGRVIFAIMSFGGFLGIGKRFHPLPWELLKYDTQKGGYVVNLDRAALEAAPHYTREELQGLGGGKSWSSFDVLAQAYPMVPPYFI